MFPHDILQCPSCSQESLEQVRKDIVVCSVCKSWFPIVDGVLELLPSYLGYKEDRLQSFLHYATRFKLKRDKPSNRSFQPQKKQQSHFDWYEGNNTQSYQSYEKSIFWQCTDALTWRTWLSKLPRGALVLDVGCAQGRSSAPFVKHGMRVIGFDISKEMIKSAQKRFRRYENAKKPPYFFVGDATRFPFQDETFDAVILHGVLHHLEHPHAVCQEIARVLKPNGIYLGLENNKTLFRFLFDFLQKIFPIWYEEAGEEPLISKEMFQKWFIKTSMRLSFTTRVFVPPHVINLLPKKLGYFLLLTTDLLFRKIPLFASQGGAYCC